MSNIFEEYTIDGYTNILNVTDIPEDKIVYQRDSGWWYDWDLSKYSDEELQSLIDTNIIYKKEEKE